MTGDEKAMEFISNKIAKEFTADFIRRIELINKDMEKQWCLLPDDFSKEPKDNLLGAITLLRVAIRTLKGLST